MSGLFRDQLLAAAEEASFPAEQTPDPETGVSTLDPGSEASIRHILDLFGVTGLSPADENVDKVINTVCTLATEVAAHVQSLNAVAGVVADLEAAAAWHPDYRAYVSALWQGDRAEVARWAASLRLHGGIPNGSHPLEAGPLG